jgi:hypothetical protein
MASNQKMLSEISDKSFEENDSDDPGDEKMSFELGESLK